MKWLKRLKELIGLNRSKRSSCLADATFVNNFVNNFYLDFLALSCFYGAKQCKKRCRPVLRAAVQKPNEAMKNLTKTLLALGFASAIAATTAVAQLNIQATFDENGHGKITGAALAGLTDPYTVPFGVGVDPVSGLTTLFYTLPTPVTSGDILLFEPGQTGYSDLIRFVPSGNASRMYFFSELEATDVPPFDLADGAILPPPNPLTAVVLLDEAGVEGNNGATWKPLTPADPGFAAAVGPSVTYNFISDAVPEPNTLALLGLGGGLLLVAQRRRAART